VEHTLSGEDHDNKLPELLSPLQGLNSFCWLTQGGARFTSLALGYYLSGLRPFQFEPRYLGCYGCDSYYYREESSDPA
jgi:hypothetical protein